MPSAVQFSLTTPLTLNLPIAPTWGGVGVKGGAVLRTLGTAGVDQHFEGKLQKKKKKRFRNSSQ